MGRKKISADDLNFMSLYQVAEKTTLSINTIRKMVFDGRLPSKKIGRRRVVLQSDFIKFCNEGLQAS